MVGRAFGRDVVLVGDHDLASRTDHDVAEAAVPRARHALRGGPWPDPTEAGDCGPADAEQLVLRVLLPDHPDAAGPGRHRRLIDACAATGALGGRVLHHAVVGLLDRLQEAVAVAAVRAQGGLDTLGLGIKVDEEEVAVVVECQARVAAGHTELVTVADDVGRPRRPAVVGRRRKRGRRPNWIFETMATLSGSVGLVAMVVSASLPTRWLTSTFGPAIGVTAAAVAAAPRSDTRAAHTSETDRRSGVRRMASPPVETARVRRFGAVWWGPAPDD